MTARDLNLLATLFKTEGLRAVLNRLATRFLSLHTFSVYRLRSTDELRPAEAPAGIEIKEVTQDELRALRRGRTDLPEYFYRDETEVLERCWVGLKDGWLGFVLWGSGSRSPSGLIRVGPNEFEFSYCYSLPEVRGNHLTTIAHLLATRDLFAQGVTTIWGVCDAHNPPMVRSLSACGFHRIGSIRRFGFLTWPRAPVDYSRASAPGPGTAAEMGRAPQL